MPKDPFKKLHRNMRMSGGRSQRADKDKRQASPFYQITVTVEDLRRKYTEQNGMCFWTGIPLEMHRIFESHDMEMPSVDRLDNTRGYDYDNIVLTTRFINVGRGRYPPDKTRSYIAKLTVKRE